MFYLAGGSVDPLYIVLAHFEAAVLTPEWFALICFALLRFALLCLTLLCDMDTARHPGGTSETENISHWNLSSMPGADMIVIPSQMLHLPHSLHMLYLPQFQASMYA